MSTQAVDGKQTTQTATSPNQQSSLAQLWANFGGVPSTANNNNNGNNNNNNSFGMQSHSMNGNNSNYNNNNHNNSNGGGSSSVATSSTSGGGGSNSNNENNYVNFNQFIIQHNLLNSNVVSTSASANAVGMSGGSPSMNFVNTGENNSGGGYYNFTTAANVPQHKSSNNLEFCLRNNLNFYNPNSNLFPYNNMVAYMNGGDGAAISNGYNLNAAAATTTTNNIKTPTTINNDYNNYYENLYTPFGQSNMIHNGSTIISATTTTRTTPPITTTTTQHYANPFATGFDFSASSLQADAPEFVPRFNSLNLNDHNNSNANINNITTTTATSSLTTKATNTKNNDNMKDADNSQANENSRKIIGNKNIENNATPTEHVTQPRNGNGGATSKIQGGRLSNGFAGQSQQQQQQQQTSKQQQHQQHQQQQQYTNGNSPRMEQKGKSAVASNARAERERERDNRRFQHSRRNVDYMDRDEQFQQQQQQSSSQQQQRNERNGDRMDRRDRGERGGERGERNDRNDRNDRGERGDRGGRGGRGNRERDYHHQRYENNRSNKRQDDWNRNRDRINGFRDTLSDMNNKESPLPSPEKKSSPRKIYPEHEKLSQREKLIRDIETRRLECLVCVEPIKTHNAVWSCHNCYHILHLQCIIKWASSSKSDDGWRCPACQNVVKDVPRDYYCFCGKVKNPTYNRQDVAHSCGEVCGRVEGCSHACTLLCHPGPCPACQAQVKRECGCGQTTKIMQCCLKEDIACDAVCGKLLNCEVHTCAAKCHKGKCEPCGAKVAQTCHCSKQERQVSCTRDTHDKHTYSCGKPCGKDLTCGNHKCKDCCHAGECRPCKQSPEVVTTCPCGKMPVLAGQRTSCLDPIPLCEGVCGKTLRCGKAAHPHHCISKCHLGNCPPCNKQTAVKCRCGHMDQIIKCRQLSTRADDARCKKRCVKKRSCGKHKCNQECCIDIDHICPLPCNYTLSCGKHKCDQPCHRGNCRPCYRSSFEELYCECGAEVIYPPVPCGTKRPICKRPCSRTHPCEHPPQHNCHSSPTCPPCMIFTTKWCFGQHEQRKTIPCSRESFSCGLSCQKPLPCGRHKCIKTCHEGVCQVAGEVCKQSCTKLRASCGHKCMAPCHDGDCPETQCKEMVEVQCECGNRKQMRTCHELAREYSRIATAQLASSMAEMQRGNYMELSEILAPVKMNKTNKTLDCNEECRLIERNRRLAIGLQIRNPDLPQKLLTKYSDFTRNFAKRDPALVKTIYDALTNLVKLAKESKQKSRSHSFPTMNREKRQLVHEMCEMFGVESVAYDAEPNRNVVATAYRDRSWLPATSIMEVMQREAGQRRVPVPSNNAWGVKR